MGKLSGRLSSTLLSDATGEPPTGWSASSTEKLLIGDRHQRVFEPVGVQPRVCGDSREMRLGGQPLSPMPNLSIPFWISRSVVASICRWVAPTFRRSMDKSWSPMGWSECISISSFSSMRLSSRAEVSNASSYGCPRLRCAIAKLWYATVHKMNMHSQRRRKCWTTPTVLDAARQVAYQSE
jgi:hypothetical protein